MSDSWGDGDEGGQGAAPGGAPPQSSAGEFGMFVFLAALSSFFLGGIVIYLLVRRMHPPWPPAGFPALPSSLWLSTLDILFTSITVQGAVLAARRGDATGLRRNLVATLVLGLGFLGLQCYAWRTVWRQVSAIAGLQSSYLKMFYLLTGLHAAHVVGGLVPLAVVTILAYRGRPAARERVPRGRRSAPVRYTALYWHFLDAVWCAIFVVVYLL